MVNDILRPGLVLLPIKTLTSLNILVIGVIFFFFFGLTLFC